MGHEANDSSPSSAKVKNA